jgi:FixJ family two-component response regulator
MADDPGLVHVVHSDSDVLLFLFDILSSAGFRVAASSSALDGLSYLARSRPSAVLCRWDMPEMEGEEFIERAKKTSPGTQIVMCFRSADVRLYKHVLSLGGHDLLREPMSASAVLHAISRVTGVGVPCQPEAGVKVEWPDGISHV